MANTYKDIITTPNRGSANADPTIEFRGGNATSNTLITLTVYPDSNGTISFDGSAGQLFSITNDLSGLLWSVNDVSGIPSAEVYSNGTVSLAPFSGNVGVGFSSGTIADKLSVNGNVNANAFILNTGVNLGDLVASAANTVRVSANSGSTINAANGLNFINSASVTVSVTAGVNGNANISFSASGASPADAYAQANAAYDQANLAYSTANTANTIAKNAYNAANTVGGIADFALTTALGAGANALNAYAQANTARDTANLAYGVGNVRDIPQNIQNATYTFALSDRGGHVIKTNTTAYTWTIPLNSGVAFPIGTAILLVNDSGTGAVTIARTSGVALLDGATDANYTLAVNSARTILKIGTDRWRVV